MAILTGWLRLTASGKVANGPVLLAGVIVNATVTGSYVTLYHGEDSDVGAQICQFKVDGVGSQVFNFANPIYLPRGLYCVVGSDVTEVLISWLPLDEG